MRRRRNGRKELNAFFDALEDQRVGRRQLWCNGMCGSWARSGRIGCEITRKFAPALFAVALGACAVPVRDQQPAPTVQVRDLKPLTTVQPQDSTASCAELEQEIRRHNLEVTQLAKENGWQLAQNGGTGADGLFVWPIWFAMDFKGSTNLTAASLQARQQHLATIVAERCSAARSPSTQPSQR